MVEAEWVPTSGIPREPQPSSIEPRAWAARVSVDHNAHAAMRGERIFSSRSARPHHCCTSVTNRRRPRRRKCLLCRGIRDNGAVASGLQLALTRDLQAETRAGKQSRQHSGALQLYRAAPFPPSSSSAPAICLPLHLLAPFTCYRDQAPWRGYGLLISRYYSMSI